MNMYDSIVFLPLFFALSAALSTSPWSASEWKFSLNFGRESSTELPRDWGASGARLVLPVLMSVESDTVPSKHIDAVIGSGAMEIKPTQYATYINSRGENTVNIENGGWKVELSPGGKGLASGLKMCFDLQTKLERNDVIVSPERLYLFAPCWREDEYVRGKNILAPIIATAEQAQRNLDANINHETGDRRLDGGDPLETALAYKDMAVLVAERDECKRKQREAEKVYPRESEILGFWPGNTEPLAIGRGTIFIKKKKLFGDELHVVGRWNAKPVMEVNI